MKINEVEKIVGITKKNIRFYEEQGLLSPKRNKENGYREYDDSDVKSLEQIKLLRKLGIPIDEIRSMQSGESTVSDSMKRHLITIDRAKQNLAQSEKFCIELSLSETTFANLDAHQFLSRMDEAEKSGAAFKNIRTSDIKSVRYAGAIAAAIIMTALMSVIFFVMIWAMKTKPEDSPPLILTVIFMAIPVIVVMGVLFSLIQRIREIKEEEIKYAKKF